MARKRVLLGHLNSNGDCLFATVIARQIKEADYPNCHLTWAVNSRCKQSVFLNPYVDDIWEIPAEKTVTSQAEWSAFVSQTEEKRKNGEFDFVFLTQIFGENILNYDGGIRSSIYNNYPHKITVSHQPIIQLSEAEVENVRRFAEQHRLEKYERVILIECGPDSFDVALTPQAAYELAFADDHPVETAFILSSNKQISSARPNVIDASGLTFRENAELTKYCDLFVGCGSGISWLATTGWAKKLNMVLIINQANAALPSMIYDHEYLNLPTDHIIEIKSDERSMEKLGDCLSVISTDGFAAAKKSFGETIELSNFAYLTRQFEITFMKSDFAKFFSCVSRSIKRNGIRMIFTRQFRGIVWNMQGILRHQLLKVVRIKAKRHLS